MPNPKKLIYIEDFRMRSIVAGIQNGYVWDTDGMLLKVSTAPMPTKKATPDYLANGVLDPNNRFSTFNQKEITISLVDFGKDNDVVYDIQGNFIGSYAGGSGKGMVKILLNTYPRPQWDMQSNGFLKLSTVNEKHLLALKDIDLQPQAYSKIFTHIVSLMDDKGVQGYLRHHVICIEIELGRGKFLLYGKDKRGTDRNALAYHTPSDSKITAYIDKKMDYNNEVYSTTSNIQSVLGAHEISGHAVKGFNETKRTHHMVDINQMIDPSWKTVTDSLRQMQTDHFWDHVKKYESEYKSSLVGKRYGIKDSQAIVDWYEYLRDDLKYVPSKELKTQSDSIRFINSLINLLKKQNK